CHHQRIRLFRTTKIPPLQLHQNFNMNRPWQHHLNFNMNLCHRHRHHRYILMYPTIVRTIKQA
ncbi:unnamed protein product, partial [Prunus brigantina]